MKSIPKILIIVLIFAVIGLLVLEIAENPEQRSEFESRVDDSGEVIVSAEPVSTEDGLDIILNMDTHTVDLEEDLKEVSYINQDDQKHYPVGWEGDPPGGHHRSGRLFFEVNLDEFTLHIESIGGESKKFNW